LKLASEAETRWLAVEFWIEKGRRTVKAGDVDGAIAIFQKALTHIPNIAFDLQGKAGRVPTEVLVEEGRHLARQGKVREAIDAYIGAKKLDPAVKISASRWNSLCWFGSLWGYANEVMFACERAVALEAESWHIRDSRGVARAITGNITGAIDDFQSFIKGTGNHEEKLRRQRWIEALRSGENPFTAEEIKMLFDQ
jgi:tetratricopeptide (TPR) repeat protein